MLKKQTLWIGGIVLGTWLLAWVIFLRPYHRDISNFQQKMKLLHANISGLYQSEYPPYPKLLDQLEEQNKTLLNQLQSFVENLNIPLKERYPTSVVEFRGQWDEQLRQIRQQANSIGIAVEEKLGFSQALPSNISEPYWIAEDLGIAILQQLLELATTQKELKKINQLNFLDLEQAPMATQPFLRQFKLEIVFESSPAFVPFFLQSISKPSNRLPYLTVSEMTMTIGSQADTISTKCILAGLIINPTGKLEAKPLDSSSGPQSVPIWEK